MSDKTDIKEASFYIDWLEKSITDEYFNHYEYSELKDLQYIGEGSFGKIMRANWKSNHFFALKSFKNDKVTLKEIVNEVLVLQLL
jgi:putative IMPACT (imprinted ancient) family translation regulator